MITLAAGILFCYDGYLYRTKMEANKPEGYVYPSIKDGWITMVAAIFFSVTEVYIIRPIL